MTAYQNVGLVNSPNINNNNNNLNTTATTTNSKSSTMPKYFYQQTSKPNKRDLASPHSTSSDNDVSTNSNETSKRINNTNGKFSIQKMFRQGFSSWRTRRKLPQSLSTPPPSFLSTNTSTPPTISSSTTHRMTPDNDLSQTHPSTTLRSASVDSMSPQRIIVTEQIAPIPSRSTNSDNVTVDFDRPPTVNVRGYIQSPWAQAPTSTETLPVQLSESSQTIESPRPKIPPPGIV
jgi:hypothetical protein